MLRKLRLFREGRTRRDRQPQQDTFCGNPPADWFQQSPDQEDDGFLLVGETAIERSTVRPNNVNSATSYLDAPPSYESQVSNTTPCPAYHQLQFNTMGQRSSNLVTTEISPEYVGSTNTAKSHDQDEVRKASLPLDPLERPYFNHAGSNTNLNNAHRTPRSAHTPFTERASSVISTLPGEIITEEELRASARTPFPDPHTSTMSGVPFKLAPWLECKDWDLSSLEGLTIPNISLDDYQYDFTVERNTLRAYNAAATSNS